jgi:L-fucose mutarotase/ribose pyranase (RbsD/FucU family)
MIFQFPMNYQLSNTHFPSQNYLWSHLKIAGGSSTTLMFLIIKVCSFVTMVQSDESFKLFMKRQPLTNNKAPKFKNVLPIKLGPQTLDLQQTCDEAPTNNKTT